MTRLWCFVGLPLSGKTYTASILAKRLGFPHFSSGDIARELMTTPELIAQTVQADLFPKNEELMTVLTAKINDACLHSEHILVDGFPRSDLQATYLADEFWHLGPEVIEVNVGDQSTLWHRARMRAREARDLDQLQFLRRQAIASQNMTAVYEVLRKRLIPCHTIMSGDDSYMCNAFTKLARI